MIKITASDSPRGMFVIELVDDASGTVTSYVAPQHVSAVAAVDKHAGATKEVGSRAAAVGKHAGTTNATQALHTGEQAGDANSVKAPKELHEPAAAADKSPPSQDYLALIRPPPRGCPLFAAPGERLPSDCPRYLASARARPDQSNTSIA